MVPKETAVASPGNANPEVSAAGAAAAAAASAAAASSMQDVRADLQALRADLGNVMKRFLDKNMDWLKSTSSNVADKASGAAGVAEKKIRSRPFLSLAMAFLLGLLLGGLIRRT